MKPIPIDVINVYGTKIADTWKMVEESELKKFLRKKPKPKSNEICNKAFAQDTLYKNGLLFLGVGASLREGYEDTCNNDHEHVQYEKIDGRVSYPYYDQIYQLAEETGFGSNWSNIDITLFRTANQNLLKNIFKKFPKIIEKQLNLAIEMIIAANPKIIIASNALIREVFKNKYKEIKSGIKSEFDHFYGTEIINTPDKLNKIPIFFSCMLNGPGPLDNGSKERLKWHINYVNALLYEKKLSSDEEKEYKRLFNKLYPDKTLE